MGVGFPVVYAVIPYVFKDTNGNYLHAGYVASKVYLVKEQVDYYPNNRKSIKYKIIRPYRYEEDFSSRRTPKFTNTFNALYFEEKTVNEVYESYEDASLMARLESEEFWKKETCPVKSLLNKLDLKSILKEYEEKLMSLTEDMEVKEIQTRSLRIKNGGK